MKSYLTKFSLRPRSLNREKLRKLTLFRLRCNLCNRMFKAATGFHRFCRRCKQDDELFRFGECF
jgi:rRNA maturation endonuclease Nob1